MGRKKISKHKYQNMKWGYGNHGCHGKPRCIRKGIYLVKRIPNKHYALINKINNFQIKNA